MVNVVRWGLFVLAWPSFLMGAGLLAGRVAPGVETLTMFGALALWLLSGLFCLTGWAVLTVLLHIEAATRRSIPDAVSLPRERPTPPVPSFAARAD